MLVQGRGQFDGPLFQSGDRALQLLDVGGGAEAGCLPGMSAQGLRQPLLQLLDVGGLAGTAGQRVGEVGL
ncbi:hypothetical protein AB0B78_37795 [Streptomyces sp. NPDC040724]|uniref:hypothetical protein n=1 Tax=Streptomyces sp. NPDC040724 TaxID=3155612 RepID=UPI00340516AE